MSKATQQDLTGMADELGMIRAQMAALKNRETEIREAFLEAGVKAQEDEAFRAVVVEQMRTQIDWKAIAAKLQPSRQLVTAHTKQREVIQLRVSARQGAVVNG